MTNNSQRVGMATFPPELQGSMLKIGTREVWQQPRRIALQPEMGSRLRVLMPLSFPSRSSVEGLQWQTQKHLPWELEETRPHYKHPSSLKLRKLKWDILGQGTPDGADPGSHVSCGLLGPQYGLF